jgi:hypothetical protein
VGTVDVPGRFPCTANCDGMLIVARAAFTPGNRQSPISGRLFRSATPNR